MRCTVKREMPDYGDVEVQDEIREGFFDAYADESTVASVAVRRDKTTDIWFLAVGATGAVDHLPGS
jgi:hypothetical protein